MHDRLQLGITGTELVRLEGFEDEHVARLTQVVRRLISEGERLQSRSGGLMVLFEGRPGDDYVSLQAQVGGPLTQLAIVAIEENKGYDLLINLWSDDSGEDVQRFRKGCVDSQEKLRLVKNKQHVPRLLGKEPAGSEDLILLVSLLERTTVDLVSREEIVNWVLCSGKNGHYQRIHRLKEGQSFSLKGTLKNWLFG